MLETQSFASATALMRGQILPPSEMKSLYGSTTKRALILLSYVGVFMAGTPAVVGTTFLPRARSARTRYVKVANVPSSQPSNPQRYAYPCRCLLNGFLPRVSGPTSPQSRTAPQEAS